MAGAGITTSPATSDEPFIGRRQSRAVPALVVPSCTVEPHRVGAVALLDDVLDRSWRLGRSVGEDDDVPARVHLVRKLAGHDLDRGFPASNRISREQLRILRVPGGLGQAHGGVDGKA